MSHLPLRARRGDQTVGRVEDEDIIGIEHGIDGLAGLKLVHAVQHCHPVRSVAGQMHKTLRTGDLGHRHRGVEGVAVGLAIGEGELMRAEADAIGAVGER